jgi:hypothetical protein
MQSNQNLANQNWNKMPAAATGGGGGGLILGDRTGRPLWHAGIF